MGRAWLGSSSARPHVAAVRLWLPLGQINEADGEAAGGRPVFSLFMSFQVSPYGFSISLQHKFFLFIWQVKAWNTSILLNTMEWGSLAGHTAPVLMCFSGWSSRKSPPSIREGDIDSCFQWEERQDAIVRKAWGVEILLQPFRENTICHTSCQRLLLIPAEKVLWHDMIHTENQSDMEEMSMV